MKPLKCALACSGAFSGLLLSTSALAGTPGWTLSEASGPVTVASSGLIRVASRGATLNAGDVIATGAKGRAVLVRGQEYLVVAPGSQIKVADPAKSGGMTQIIEQIGNVVYKIKKMTMPHFAVETPFLAAVVKGTTFSVTVTERGASVQVLEGRVEVETRDGGARYLVLPGDIGSVAGTAPGRLNVQGRETRAIDSPTAGGSVAAPTAQILQAEPAAAAEPAATTDVHAEPASANAPAGPVIAETVSEPPVVLTAETGGMVSGSLLAVATQVSIPAPTGGSSQDRAGPAAESESSAKSSGSITQGDDKGDSGKSGGSQQSSAAERGDDTRDTPRGNVKLALADDRDNGDSGKNNGNGNAGSGDRSDADEDSASGNSDGGSKSDSGDHSEADEASHSGNSDGNSKPDSSDHSEADEASHSGNGNGNSKPDSSDHSEADEASHSGNSNGNSKPASSDHSEADQASNSGNGSESGSSKGNGNAGNLASPVIADVETGSANSNGNSGNSGNKGGGNSSDSADIADSGNNGNGNGSGKLRAIVQAVSDLIKTGNSADIRALVNSNRQ